MPPPSTVAEIVLTLVWGISFNLTELVLVVAGRVARWFLRFVSLGCRGGARAAGKGEFIGAGGTASGAFREGAHAGPAW